MTIYVLQYSTYDWNEILGVYSTMRHAKQAQQEHWAKTMPTVPPSDMKYFRPDYEIHERVLDKQPA